MTAQISNTVDDRLCESMDLVETAPKVIDLA